MNEDAERFLKRLTRCGWFRGLPDSVAEGVRERVARCTLTSEQQAALVSVVADSRYLLSDRPYAALLEQFAEASGGDLTPEGISEVLRGDRAHLSFDHAGRHYALDLPAEADEPPAAFFATINQALGDKGSPLGFYEIRHLAWGPIASFAFTSAEAFTAALAARLFDGKIPKGADAPRSESDLAALQIGVLGEATYTWRLGDGVLGTLDLPGDFDDEGALDPDDESWTTLLYENTGVVVLRWGPAFEPRRLIRGALFMSLIKKVEESGARTMPDRHVREGTSTVDGCAMAWRTDQIDGLPVQLMACVPVPLFERFARALDSFRPSEASARLLAARAPTKVRSKVRRSASSRRGRDRT